MKETKLTSKGTNYRQYHSFAQYIVSVSQFTINMFSQIFIYENIAVFSLNLSNSWLLKVYLSVASHDGHCKYKKDAPYIDGPTLTALRCCSVILFVALICLCLIDKRDLNICVLLSPWITLPHHHLTVTSYLRNVFHCFILCIYSWLYH